MRFYPFWGNFRVEVIKRKTTTDHAASWKPPKLVRCYLATAVPSPFILAHSSSPLKLNKAERVLGIYMQNKGRGRILWCSSEGLCQTATTTTGSWKIAEKKNWRVLCTSLFLQIARRGEWNKTRQNKKKVSKPRRQTVSEGENDLWIQKPITPVWFGENEWKWEIKHCFTDRRVLQEVSFWKRFCIFEEPLLHPGL